MSQTKEIAETSVENEGLVAENAGVGARWQTAFWRLVDLPLRRRSIRLLGVLLVLVASAVLRFRALGELGFNSDEAVYAGQAASLAGIESFLDDFSPFRAHPLLFQFSLSVVYRVFGFSDIAGRLIAAAFGLVTIPVTYWIGRRIFNRRVGLIAALIIAVMPYHVVVSRQTLLESAMTLFFALTMLALIRYREVRSLGAAALIGSAAGLTFMSKEVGILVLVVVAIVVFVEGGYRITHLFAGMVVFVFTVSPHLIASQLGTATESGGAGWAQYVIWQLSRPPNHPGSFYFANLPHYFGLPMFLLLILGITMLVKNSRQHPDRFLLMAWIFAPLLFFQVWKVKGYHYIVPIAPAVAVVVAYALNWFWIRRWIVWRRLAMGVAVLGFIAMGYVAATNGPFEQNYERIGDAGYAGIPGGKEAALWIADNAPEGARLLGIGPSIGNVVRFYADTDVDALSISPNPLRTNPAYEPVRNPDYQLRWGLYEYLVYDAYSATRTPHFANRILDFVDRYGGELVFEFDSLQVADDGRTYSAPVIQIYRVRPVESGAGE